MTQPVGRLRQTMLAGVMMTLVGVVGMAFSFAGEPGSRPSPWWFAPFYMVGSLLLIAGGVRWLLALMAANRQSRGPD